ncbi:hypothetical protein EVA_09620 [gut metagenome]|uniref:Uncharacterized protein n=1 Tax=gut metagenome TaxID=749906 RepID=J9G5X4_9ZZZZ
MTSSCLRRLERVRNCSALRLSFSKGPTRLSSSPKISLRRSRFSSALVRRRCASFLRYRYFAIPLASSKISRRSPLFAPTISAMRPCPIME